MTWSLPKLFEALHNDIQSQLQNVSVSLHHPGTKGDGTEIAWLELLQKYLPQRYQADKAHVVDSLGNFSQQIDVVIFDRQYSPFIFNYNGQRIIPVESVYAVFEVKQTANADHIEYAKKKIASVRALHRTSLPIPHAGGQYPPKPLIPIVGGLLTLGSDWKPALGDSLLKALEEPSDDRKLNIGCIAAHGYFHHDKKTNQFEILEGSKAATAFLLKLISELQFSGTVPMIDLMAYA
ncbi:MAG: hypothetical protein RQ757_11640, partial [Pseudomonadales bacterium]|nr:hypothetical protein [Pseudomonadales bacterium]